MLNRLVLAIALCSAMAGFHDQTWAAAIEDVTILHVGDQESWLLSAAGNVRDSASNILSFYGGVDRLAAVIQDERSLASTAGRSVLTLNAGDAFLPGPRFNASLANLATAANDGGQDFYDAIALRDIGFDAAVFGNHEFDLGPDLAARFAQMSGTTYLSSNLNFSGTPAFQSLANSGTVAASKIVTTAAGNKIGLVGATTPLLPSISSPGAITLKNFDPALTEAQNLTAMTTLVQAEVDALRNQGATTIVLMSHLQNASNEINLVIPQLRNVDVVLSGGGHELMASPSDVTIQTNASPAAFDLPALSPYPNVVSDANGEKVLVTTSNFGNRYVGVLNLQLDAAGEIQRDGSGIPVLETGTKMRRVSGRPEDADRVVGDASLQADVVAPVTTFINALNSQVIGQSEIALNGARGAAATATTPFVPGVRNAETNLGNLVADAFRFVGQTDIALQNGGGIRASINDGPVTRGEAFDTLPFTNLVVKVDEITPSQLKALLEHGVAASTPLGSAQGRFPQLSGMSLVFDSRLPAGSRVLQITLDDGTPIVNNGVIAPLARNVSMSTIDFLANGGDGYPFQALGLDFENLTNTILYQEALEQFLAAAPAAGGLGGQVTAARYATVNPFDGVGRITDVAAVPEPATLLLAALGGSVLLWAARRRAA